MRAPFQILAIPYRREPDERYAVLRRSDGGWWQFVAGGGEDGETPEEAAEREIREETGVSVKGLTRLTFMAYVPANVIAERHRRYWAKDVYVLPEYYFAFECATEIRLSREHLDCQWLSYDEAAERLKWESNRIALYELHCRLSAGKA